MDRQFRPYLPSDGAIRRRLQRSRRKDQPPLPLTLEDLNIQGKNLEDGNGEEMILMFATAANLHHLSKADVWYGGEHSKFALNFFISYTQYMQKYMAKYYPWYSACYIPNPKSAIDLCRQN